MSEVDQATQKLWDGDKAIEQGRYSEAIELLEWVVQNPPHAGYQYMAAHAICRAYAKQADSTNDDSSLQLGSPENKKLLGYMDLVIDMFPEMPPDIQRGMPIDSHLELRTLFRTQGAGLRTETRSSASLKTQKQFGIPSGRIIKTEIGALDSSKIAKRSIGRTSSGGGFIASLIVVIICLVCVGFVWNGITNRSSPRSSVSTSIGTQPKWARVTKTKASVRSQPNDQNKPIATFSKNERLELLSPNYSGRGWYNVRHPSSGMIGWIHGNNIEFVR